MPIKKDPETFSKCAMPHPDKAAAEAAVEAFLAAVADLRIKHRIKNMYMILETSALEGEAVVPYALSMFRGDATAALPMVATAYGAERERHEQMIVMAIKQGRESAK